VGKKILLSLGGAAGSYGFTSDAQAESFADTIWDLFGNGGSLTRPFGDAIVDGFDLDIEGGSTIGYAAFITRMRSHYANDTSKTYYISAAPQCPIPDAYLNTALTTAHFDFIFVQFYNNYCSPVSSSS
jgi:chitinase